MKKTVIAIGIGISLNFLTACTADNSEDHNTGNGSMESPINGIPPGEPDSMAKDHARVDHDTIHK
jgi:hypothetical protein